MHSEDNLKLKEVLPHGISELKDEINERFNPTFKQIICMFFVKPYKINNSPLGLIQLFISIY